MPQRSSKGGFRTPLKGREHGGVKEPLFAFGAVRRVLVFPSLVAATANPIAKTIRSVERAVRDFLKVGRVFMDS